MEWPETAPREIDGRRVDDWTSNTVSSIERAAGYYGDCCTSVGAVAAAAVSLARASTIATVDDYYTNVAAAALVIGEQLK